MKKSDSLKEGQIIRTPFFSYKIISPIGEGGAGYVFKVERQEDARFFALKLLKKDAPSEKLKRFKNEFGFSFNNVHPNIIILSPDKD